MDDRLVVVGMCNPLSDAPALALWTDPDGCTGHRLWSLATHLTGVSEDEWLALTDRRNLCVGDWDRRRAEEQAREWAPELRDRTVVLLGTSVMTTMVRVGELARPLAPLEWARDRDWFLLPHTSGLCRFWNSQGARMAASLRLADLLWRMGWQDTTEDAA